MKSTATSIGSFAGLAAAITATAAELKDTQPQSVMPTSAVHTNLVPRVRWPLKDKTLVAWVSPANLTQRGGSVLTIEKPGGVFDAIVFGELTPATWMPGSDGFRRTGKQQQDFPKETVANPPLVQIAIVYRDREITLYRNGQQAAKY